MYKMIANNSNLIGLLRGLNDITVTERIKECLASSKSSINVGCSYDLTSRVEGEPIRLEKGELQKIFRRDFMGFTRGVWARN